MIRILALLIACDLAAHANAVDTINMKDLTLPAFEGEELVAVPLDSDIYDTSLSEYVDLRIYNDKEKQQAYVVRRGQTTRERRTRQTWEATALKLNPLDDGGLEITFHSDPGKHPEPPQGIRFESRLVNFDHHVRVEVSADGKDWQTVVDDGLIFDYSQFMDVRNLALDLNDIPKDRREFFRVTINDVTQEQQSQLMELSRNLSGGEETDRTERITINRQPFRIDRIELWRDNIVQDVAVDQQTDYPLAIDHIDQDAKTKETLVYLKSHREPLNRLTILTPNRNFSRRVRLEGQVDEAMGIEWQPIAESLLTHIDFRTLKRESLSIGIPENRRVAYRLVIENNDNPPLEVTGVTAKGQVYEAVFLATAGAAYNLTYGNNSPRPAYDTAAITASLGEGFKPLVATLGDEVAAEAPPEPAEPLLKRLLNNSVAMTAIIGVLVLVLAAGLYGATRSIDQINES